MTTKKAEQCGIEEKIYDEVGMWVGSVTCHLNERHDGRHRAVFSWDTEAQKTQRDWILGRILGQKENWPRLTEKGGGE
jgi:hypothetical protein